MSYPFHYALEAYHSAGPRILVADQAADHTSRRLTQPDPEAFPREAVQSALPQTSYTCHTPTAPSGGRVARISAPVPGALSRAVSPCRCWLETSRKYRAGYRKQTVHCDERVL